MHKIFILALVLGISGCAFNPQAVQVTADLKPSGKVQGRGKNINVNVVDERASANLGQRGFRNVGAELTIQGDLAKIIKSSVESGLQQQGFIPASSGAKLKVEIRNLDYKTISGLWSGAIRAECGLKAVCAENGLLYEKFYRGFFEKNVHVIATDEENNQYVSSAITDSLNQLINDAELGRCLGQ